MQHDQCAGSGAAAIASEVTLQVRRCTPLDGPCTCGNRATSTQALQIHTTPSADYVSGPDVSANTMHLRSKAGAIRTQRTKAGSGGWIDSDSGTQSMGAATSVALAPLIDGYAQPNSAQQARAFSTNTDCGCQTVPRQAITQC